MLSGYKLEALLLIFSINCLLLPYTTCKFVRCNFGTEVVGKCHCLNIRRDETPWPKATSPTAPKPQNASMQIKSFKGKLYPKIRWKLKKQYVEYVAGFYVQLRVDTFYQYYSCAHNASKILKNHHDSLLVEYEFKNCCRTLYNGFENGDVVHVTIHSLPMYAVDEKNHFVEAWLTVGDEPESDERDISESEEELTSEPDPVYYGDMEGYDRKLTEIQNTLQSLENKFSQSDGASISVVTVVVAVLITVIIFGFGICLTVAYFRRTPRNLQSAKSIRHVLLIGDEDEYCIKLLNGFTEIFKKSSDAGVDVVSNIRRTSEIASVGIVSWTTENFSQSDVVVMLISDPSSIKSAFAAKEENKSFKKSPVHVALNVAESAAVKSNFRILRKKCVLLHVHSGDFKSLAFCSHYVLKTQFKEMLKHALGNSYDSSVDVKGDFEKLLELGKENDHGDDTKKCVDVRKKTAKPHTNNLDVSLSPNQVGLTSDVNDFSMESRNPAGSDYTSVENNERAV